MMRIVIDDYLKEVDYLFKSIFKYLNIIRHVNPINLDEEKEAFFSGKIRNPVFRYKRPRFDLNRIRDVLNRLSFSDDYFGMVFKRLKQEFLIRCDLIEAIGKDDSVVRDLSAEIFGWPNSGLVVYAKTLLDLLDKNKFPLDFSSNDVYYSIKDMIDVVGLDDWDVCFSKKWFTATKQNKKIFVCKNRFFSSVDVNRLAVHEVGVHAIRYANGYMQPLKIFGYGFPDFLKIEEGLATYFEEVTDNLSVDVLRSYAGRVIAVDCLHREIDFRDCFNELRGYGFNCDDSWNLAVRVYRGGGFVKDHIYLEGYLMVKRFVSDGGDLKKLFVGKVGLDNLEMVDLLLKKGYLKEPVYLPPFL